MIKTLLIFLFLTGSAFACSDKSLHDIGVCKVEPSLSFTVDTTWCSILGAIPPKHPLIIKDFQGLHLPYSGNTVVFRGSVESWSKDFICFMNECNSPKQPLISKIDTIRVDTVGFHNSKHILSALFNDTISYWVHTPIVEFITDTSYLSPEQVKLLGGVK